MLTANDSSDCLMIFRDKLSSDITVANVFFKGVTDSFL
jgi:hypothetical protein